MQTAPLRDVIVHTPGEEVGLVSPENKDELLFDDLIFPDVARDEHQTMVALNTLAAAALIRRHRG